MAGRGYGDFVYIPLTASGGVIEIFPFMTEIPSRFPDGCSACWKLRLLTNWGNEKGMLIGAPTTAVCGVVMVVVGIIPCCTGVVPSRV